MKDMHMEHVHFSVYVIHFCTVKVKRPTTLCYASILQRGISVLIYYIFSTFIPNIIKNFKMCSF